MDHWKAYDEAATTAANAIREAGRLFYAYQRARCGVGKPADIARIATAEQPEKHAWGEEFYTGIIAAMTQERKEEPMQQ
jgi:hypothetical protein